MWSEKELKCLDEGAEIINRGNLREIRNYLVTKMDPKNGITTNFIDRVLFFIASDRPGSMYYEIIDDGDGLLDIQIVIKEVIYDLPVVGEIEKFKVLKLSKESKEEILKESLYKSVEYLYSKEVSSLMLKRLKDLEKTMEVRWV